ncbi:unnamed protein product [Effrenium voratum]|uniref:Uncharacterized protein n=1 Tax=Effrenium voratum TaxID=2562239 RepID=A0AA36J053_9DINO|nr:unnamed protein product [Effrenium voratum]
MDVRTTLVLELLGGPHPVARLACSCRELLQTLRDRAGRLRVSNASFSASQVALLALNTDRRPLSLDRLRSLRLDVLEESGRIPERMLDQLLSSLGSFLASKSEPLPLEELSLRLASYGSNARPLRPSASARASLLRGLAGLHLRRLELSFLPLQRKEIQQEVDLGEGKVSFLSMLQGQGLLKDLRLTHNGMYGEVALQLVKAQGAEVSNAAFREGASMDPDPGCWTICF